MELPKPLAVLETRCAEAPPFRKKQMQEFDLEEEDVVFDEELEEARTESVPGFDIVAIIKKKILFASRPMPVAA